METDALKSFDGLQNELEKAKTNLKGLNDNIRRIIGRDPPDTTSNPSRNERKRSFGDSRESREVRRNDYNNPLENRLGRHRDNNTSPPPPSKRRQGDPKSVFSRLSGPPHRDENKPKLSSRVIRELPTRQEIVDAQGNDAEARARNKRMFGCLLGTLQKFSQEESRLKPKEEKKAQIEKKLEEQQLLERLNLKKERQNLFTDRKKQQMEIKMIEVKMARLKDQKAWEESKKPLLNFICTNSKPRIYYKPKIMDKKSENKLVDSRVDLEKLIERKRQELNDELASIQERYKTDQKISSENENNSKNNQSIDEEDENDYSDVEMESKQTTTTINSVVLPNLLIQVVNVKAEKNLDENHDSNKMDVNDTNSEVNTENDSINNLSLDDSEKLN